MRTAAVGRALVVAACAVVAVVTGVASAGDPPAANLVPNGSLEAEGRGGPAKWQRPDGLTSFWEKDPLRGGACLRFDTDVKLDEFRARRAQMEEADPPPAPEKSPTRALDYGTVAGTEGVPFYSDWIAIEPGVRYTLSVDARADRAGKTPKVFLKGYAETEEDVLGDDGKPAKRTFRRVFYKVFKDCACGTDWKTFTITVCPTADDPRIRWVRVMLFPYWPQGTYWFDEVRLVAAGREPGVEERWKAHAADRDAAARRVRAKEVAEAQATLRFVAHALDTYKADLGAWPTTSQGLAALWTAPEPVGDWGGPYMTALDVDPWGMPYRYVCPGRAHPESYDLTSTGPDGAEGGGDDVAP